MKVRVFRVILATLLVFSSIAFSNLIDLKAEAATASKTGIITNSYANIYKGPGKAYGTSGQIVKGELVKVSNSSNGWTFIEGSTGSGWIWNTFVKTSAGAGVIANTSYANLYAGSSKSSGTLGRVDKDSIVELFEKKNGWHHVYANGQEGWVWGEYAAPVQGEGIVNISKINLYKDAKKSSGTIASIEKGTSVATGEVKNGWRLIYTNGKKGWAWDPYVTKSSKVTTQSVIVTNEGYVNVYRSNGKAYGTSGKLLMGDRAVEYFQIGNWSYVSSKSVQGWVWKNYITPVNQAGIIADTTYANLYKGPGKSTGIIKSLNKGTNVKVFEGNNGWIKVEIGDNTGWIWGSYVQSNTSVTGATVGTGKTTTSVNVYKGPGKSNGTIGSIPKSTDLNCYELYNGWRYVHAGSFQGWVWDEYVQSSIEDSLSSLTVFLDPGHGQTDPGASGYGLKEKDVVLDIGLETKRLFDKTPINVKMTRESDSSSVTANGSSISTSDSLNLRTDYVAKNKQSDNDIFVSIHANAGGGTGGETYYYKNRRAAVVNPYESDSQLLAQFIQKRLVSLMQLKDRGVKDGNFAVLRENILPAALVETGFIDTKEDAEKLGSDYWRGQAAKAIYLGILDYYNAKGYYVTPYL